MLSPITSKQNTLASLAWILFLVGTPGCRDQGVTVANANSGSAQADKVTDVDAARAFSHVKNMVALGPRPAGSPALRKAKEYIENELKSYKLKTVEDSFNGDTPHGKIPMVNIIAELPGRKSDVVLITGHYDTAPFPGFVGANDGGSSAASVLEMARVLAGTTPEYTLWFVFFDGEEAVVKWEDLDNTYGSRHLSAKWAADGTLKRVRAMILVDMIGDKNLDISRDGESTPWMVNAIWDTARQVGYGKYFLGNEAGYSDDHIAFETEGVPVVDIIDFDYGPDNSYWHTNQDTLDKVSGESIKVVSDVVIRALPTIFNHLNGPRQNSPQ